jgi:hypothetical protein
MHTSEPIAGLRSIGKGANRSILDCLFHPTGRFKRLLADLGVADTGSLFRPFASSVAERVSGRRYERVWDRDDRGFGGTDTP